MSQANSESVRIAGTDSEREAVYRLRYDVLVSELRQSHREASHLKKILKVAEDTAPGAALLYSGELAEPNASLLINGYEAGEVPPTISERFAVKLFSDLAGAPVGEISQIVISRGAHSGFALQALMRTAFLVLARDQGARYIFLQTAPALLGAFKRLGFRPYSAEIDFSAEGIKVPMVLATTDLDYLSSVKSPLLGLAREVVHLHSRGAKNLEYPYLETTLQLDEDVVWFELQQAMLQSDVIQGSFMDGLSQKALSYLSDKGFIISIAENRPLVRENTVEEEMFVILDGLFEVTHEKQRVALLGKGDLCGELAFFLESQQRTATVTSLTDSRVLIIKRKFLKELANADPELCSELLFKICQTLARRLAGML